MLIWEGLKGISRWGILSDGGWKEVGLGLVPKSSPCSSFLIPEWLKNLVSLQGGEVEGSWRCHTSRVKIPKPQSSGIKGKTTPLQLFKLYHPAGEKPEFCRFLFFKNLQLDGMFCLHHSPDATKRFHPVLHLPPGRLRAPRRISEHFPAGCSRFNVTRRNSLQTHFPPHSQKKNIP